MKVRKTHIQNSAVYLLIFLHFIFILGELVNHDHHFQYHHSNILAEINCNYGSDNLEHKFLHYTEEQDHKCCSEEISNPIYIKIASSSYKANSTDSFIIVDTSIINSRKSISSCFVEGIPRILQSQFRFTPERAPPLA